MRRRDFIKFVAGSAAAWPLVAHAEQQTMPVIGLLDLRSADTVGDRLPAFRRGLKESGYVEGENVTIVYRWAENEIGRVPELAADLVGRKVNVLATVGNEVGLIAKKATQSTPIVFVVSQDPVSLGLVASLARPGSNVTGINFFSGELVGKQLGLLRELVPAASTSADIDAAFLTLVRERYDALLLASDPFFSGRRVQLVSLATRHAIPTIYPQREFAEIGGLMSYGSSITDAWRQSGAYVGRILAGAKPADLPVLQSNKLELVINAQTARIFGLAVPAALLARADEVIE